MRVSAAVRPKLDSLAGPVANLFRGHQIVRAAAPGLVPCVSPTQSLGHYKNSTAKSMLPEDGQCIFSGVGVCVVKGEKDWLLRKALPIAHPVEPIGRLNANISSSREPSDLSLKLLG